MIKTRKFMVIFIGILILTLSIFFWAINSPAVNDLYFLYDRNTEADLAVAFTVALRMNHPAAYEMIDADLSPRLDEWMKTHQAQKCIEQAHNILSGAGSSQGFVVFFDCETENYRWYRIKVDNILVEDMKVVDWGDIREDIK